MALDPAVVKFDKALQKKIGKLSPKLLPATVKRALKRTTPTVTKYVAGRVKEEFNPKGFSRTKDLKTNPPRRDKKGSFFTEVVFKRQTFSMARYRPKLVKVGTRPRKRRRFLSSGKRQSKNLVIKNVRVKIGSRSVILPRSFIIRKGSIKLPFERTGPGKKDINLIAGPGPVAILRRKKENTRLKKIASEKFRAELNKDLDFRLSRR